MSAPRLEFLARARAEGRPRGITSVCSAHPLVIEAALREALDTGGPVLIEATCNQVNHRGGYTGMTPADFRDKVLEIARAVGLEADRIVLGGDHLGPNPWKHLDANAALQEAGEMVAAYIAAGFTKIHLDTSMGCRGEPVALDDALTASRAAQLARIAEDTVTRLAVEPPVYIVGTEVPVPGGALEAIEALEVTRPEAALRTVAAHREAFAASGLDTAFARIIGVVVQPGVEFGNANVVYYRADEAAALSGALEQLPGIVFEAHSTDYQPPSALRSLVEDGFAILKVGPGLTFALREALYGLDAIAGILDPDSGDRPLAEAMEQVMLAAPRYWEPYYHGTDRERFLQRHFSYSDRIRYYWASDAAEQAVDRLFQRLGTTPIPETLVSQYLAPLYPQVAGGRLKAVPRELCLAAVRHALAPYSAAIRPAA